MSGRLINSAAMLLILALIPSNASAQAVKNVRLHVNPRWKECSLQLDPSLTQAAWRQFTDEAGLVTYFRPLRDARPMGRGRFEVSALQWQTAIDDQSSAWNDTFVHPDSTHWLLEGSGLSFPGLTLRAGVTSKVDVGAYVTRNPKANYGFYGGQLQYNLLTDAAGKWDVATRASFVSLYGPSDLDLTVYGVDAVSSRTFRVRADWLSLSPYLGVSAHYSRSHEKSAVVNLADEHVLGAQATLGIAARVSFISLGVEYSSARVASRSMKIGVNF